MSLRTTEPVIFGLRYLETEEAEIRDVVGCMTHMKGENASDDPVPHPTNHPGTGCDDSD